MKTLSRRPAATVARAWLVAASVLSLGVVSPRVASACGGTFCDGGPNVPPMEVDQSGENILFFTQGGYVEAHVQIQYTGDPARFAWLVPMPKVPEISVGSQLLFTNLLGATVPTFSVAQTQASCGNGSSGGSGSGFGCSASFDDAAGSGDGEYFGAGGSGSGTGGGGGGLEPTVKEVVGSFEVAVLEPTSSTEIDTWLETNEFIVDPNAASIIDEYIGQGYVFVAVKLQAGAGLDEIHPLVFRYPGDEPCIPLKLTRIAATQDMGVRAFFLGDRRVVPTGDYKLVTPNELRYDWLAFANATDDNYADVIRKAVDAPGAAGKGFVTEYDGPSSIVATTGVYSTQWDASAFVGLAPETVVDQLELQGLMDCAFASECLTFHPLVPTLLRRYLPAPAGVTEPEFYACTSCYQADIDLGAWDGAAFATDLDTLVVKPGQHATSMLASSPNVTRLFTMISPDEMTSDPEFSPTQATLAPAVNAHTANLQSNCDVTQTAYVASQVGVRFRTIDGWPDFGADFPWASSVQQFDAQGALVGETDTTELIREQARAFSLASRLPTMLAPEESCTASASRGPGSTVAGASAVAAVALLGRLVARARRRRRRPVR
jgi:hypothetical protein